MEVIIFLQVNLSYIFPAEKNIFLSWKAFDDSYLKEQFEMLDEIFFYFGGIFCKVFEIKTLF